MKKTCFLFILGLITLAGAAQKKTINVSQPDTAKKVLIVEASCGECQFHMTGKGCHLAIRMEGKTYFVDGTSIDDHGDAHSSDGFCEAIKKAAVQGEIIDNRFKATYFKIVKPEAAPGLQRKKSG